MSTSQTPVGLLERLRLEPAEADWDRLLQLCQPLLERCLGPFLLQAADREDLVQEVLLVVVRELPKFVHTGQGGAFRGWLRRIAVHRCLHWLRAGRVRAVARGETDLGKSLDELGKPDSELTRQWDEEHNRHVARRLCELIAVEFEPATQRAFHRLVLEGAPAKTVAAELGLSVNAVYIAKSRVLQRLRQEIQGLID